MRKVLILLLVLVLTGCGNYGQLFSGSYGGVVENADLTSQEIYVPQNVVTRGGIKYEDGFIAPKSGVYEVFYSLNISPQSDDAYLTSYILINSSISPIGAISSLGDQSDVLVLSSGGIFELKKGDKVIIGIKSETDLTVNIKNLSISITGGNK